jgi:hypothetical protein
MKDTADFEVISYNNDTIETVLVQYSGSEREIIQRKLHLIYFREYLAELNAQTIIIETDYIDRDYLEDFSSYYVKCFHEYGRRCTRLHFFSDSFDRSSFELFLEGLESTITSKSLQESYLGFIVLKPLPQTIIGRTCLKTYPSAPNHRAFPTTRNYEVNLFGCELNIRSLAFQEQDSVVAACATSALWSAFHQTGLKFQHAVPTPVEITRSATELEPANTRSFPNVDGLNGTQMARAIRSVGLEPYQENADNTYILRSTASAYLRAGLPVILGLDLIDLSNTTNPINIGKHAVTLVGFGVGPSIDQPQAFNCFKNKASMIDRFYAHDDQVGPFSRMIIKGDIKVNDQGRCCLETSWKGRDDRLGSVVGLPDILLIPLYKKIRIPFRSIHDLVMTFDRQLKAVETGLGMNPHDLTWDIGLVTGSELKCSHLNETLLTGLRKRRFLTTGLPRFLWRAGAYSANDNILIELIFDATDIEQGCLAIATNVFDLDLEELLRAASRNTNVRKTVQEGDGRGWQIFRHFDFK